MPSFLAIQFRKYTLLNFNIVSKLTMDIFLLPVSRIFRFPQWVPDSLPRTRTACLPQNE